MSTDPESPYDLSSNKEDVPQFVDLWPTETAGDGLVRGNNKRTGAGQGKSSFKRKAPCKLCGFMVDLSRDMHDGGSLDGSGGGSTITKTTTTTTVKGETYTEYSGDQKHSKGGGCPLCHSRNSAQQGQDLDVPSTTRKPGF